MSEQETKAKYDPSWLVSLQIRCNQIFAEAAITYSTDPGKADCVKDAITECLKAIKACLPQAEGAEDDDPGQGPVYGPGCPDGFHKEGRRCVPNE